MILKFPAKNLPLSSVGMDEGFQRAVLARAKIEGGMLSIASEDWHELIRLHVIRTNRSTYIPEPTALELAANFTGALARWSAAGFPTVSAEAYAARGAVCDTCAHWQPQARLGLGKCAAPGCGCTSLKRWLATEKCPLGKWAK